MKSRTILSFCALLIVWNVLFFAAESYADKRELDKITQTIQQNKSRWSAKDTSFSKLTAEERKKRLGAQLPILSPDVKTLDAPSVSLPLKLDWRNYNNDNYVTPVKEQGTCGACWAFATAAALESKVLIFQNTPGLSMDLSEQLLTSCSGAGTCAAGSITAAADFLSNFGLPTESFYPYAESDGSCSTADADWEASAYKIIGWSLVKPTIASIKNALYNYGPLVTLMAVHTDFYYYGAGIYTYAWGGFEGYHAALIVGYDDTEQYFILKSSWGVDWGEDGYFRIAYSEMNSPAAFGAWTIAYNNALAPDFPIIDGIARDTNSPATTVLDKDESGHTNNGTKNPGQSGDTPPENSSKEDDKNKDSGKSEPKGTSALTGAVKDESGNAVSGAEIQTGKLTAITDDKGLYLLSELAAGDYVVTAGKDGYALTAADVSLLSDTTTTKDFVLTKVSADGPEDQNQPIKQKKVHGPGWIVDKPDAVSPEKAAAYYAARKKEMLADKSINMPLAAAAEDISSDIQELARGLRYDPKLIYDYVHNNIDYVPYFGSLKGATLTYLDGSGNDFDQASLLIALLRASGYTANYVYGQMTINAYNLAKWVGTVAWDGSSAYYYYITAYDALSYGGNIITNATSSGATLNRVWVKATIPGAACGTDCLFDPAYKEHEFLPKIDIAGAIGYNHDILSTAGGTVDDAGYSIRGVSETNLRNRLSTYATSLVSAIRNQYPNYEIAQVISGQKIIQTNLSSYQTSLPFSPVEIFTWATIPPEYTATLRVRHTGIDYTFLTTDLSGKRLTLTYAGSDYHPELRLDGNFVTSGNATTLGFKNDLIMTIAHPYAANNGAYGDQEAIYPLKSGATYAIAYNFGGISDNLLRKRQRQLDVYKAQGLSELSEAVRGETLHLMSQTWLKEVAMANHMLARLADSLSFFHHNIGIMAQEEGYYIDVKQGQGSVISNKYDINDQLAHTKSFALIASAFEHGMLEQLMGSDNPAVSTMKLFQLANVAENKFYYIDSIAKLNETWPKLAGYTSTGPNNDLGAFQAGLNSGKNLILPQNGQLELNRWRGKGYISKKFSGGSWIVGMVIGGDYYGGYASIQDLINPSLVSGSTGTNVLNGFDPNTTSLQMAMTGLFSTSLEPVDMASGAYLYDHTDLQLGGDAPRGLAFSRAYNSNQSLLKRTLGYGWGHNYDIYLNPGSHGDPGLGSRQPVDAASMIAAMYICLDLFKTTDTLQAWVVASLASEWAVDQVIDNAITMHVGHKVMEFIKLADGTYAPPPGITTNLEKTGATSYTLKERFGTEMYFSQVNNDEIKIQSLRDVDGNSMTFAYSGNNLTTVRDAFSRTLTFAYPGGKLGTVSDSAGRSVTLGYTGDDLTSYTDPESKVWGYGYENHRMTTLRNPLNITTATNSYDTLGRVKTQAVPRQTGTATYNFYFSGYRNQEEDPAGHTITYWYDEKGREFKITDQLGNNKTRQYDGQNHVTEALPSALGTWDHYSYDGNHNLKVATSESGFYYRRIEYYYDTQYRLTDIYLGPKEPTPHIAFMAPHIEFKYNPQHHLIETYQYLDGTNKVNTSAGYYPNGLNKSLTDGNRIKTEIIPDSYGNPYTIKIANHPFITYGYDSIGRMTGLTDQVGSATSFTYDKRSLLLSKTDPLGRVTYNGYDNAGRLTNYGAIEYRPTPSDKLAEKGWYEWYYDGEDEYPVWVPLATFTYNQLDNLTSMQDSIGTTSYTEYDAANRLKSMTDPHGFTVKYDYDALGNLKTIIYPGNKTVSYTYYDSNRVKTITIDWLGQMASYGYDAAGRLDYLYQFNGTKVDYGYDKNGYDYANRLSYLKHLNDSSVLADYTFTLDGNGNRTQVAKNEPLTTTLETGLVSYTYNDKKNRLLSASNAGNFVYDWDGQLKNGYGSSYNFDNEHRLTNISLGASYQFIYDGMGNRLRATRNGTVTRYIHDAAGNVLAEADGNNNITRYYIYGQGLLAAVTPANQVYCYHFDATGNTIAMTDGSKNIVNKYAYDAFGNITGQVEAIAQPFKYVGQYGVMAEPNGFYYMRARYYDPKVGRFISEDPIGFGGGDVNLYGYVQNNPVNYTDPTGLYWFRQSWQTDFVVGRARSLVEPGGAISRFIEDYVPAGRTFGDLHDGFVDFTAPEGSASWRDGLTNIPSMIPMYAIALGTEVLRTLGILSQPTPREKSTPCK